MIAVTHVSPTSTKLPVLFSGDTILISSIGKTDNPKQMFQSLQKLRGFSNETLIFPGHRIKKENLLFSKSIDPSNEVINHKIGLLQEDGIG